jgi:hypothetical protein
MNNQSSRDAHNLERYSRKKFTKTPNIFLFKYINTTFAVKPLDNESG